MTSARFTLTCLSQSLDAAQALADAIDEHLSIDALAVTVNETDEARALWNTVAYFEDETAAATARGVLNLQGAVIAPLPDVDWVRESLLGLAPVIAGRFFLHGSHDRARRRLGGLSFEIDAGTAFGTGHHGTTAGCLMILDRVLKQKRPQRIFDLGCGTGVLALAAAKATGVKVLATDIDPESVRVTKLNASLNRVGPQMRAVTAAGLHHREIRQAAPFDLIFANILARPLAKLAQGLSHILLPGGTLILSGLTRDQLRWIAAAYRARGLVPTQVFRIDNWVALAVTKPATKRKRPLQSNGRFKTFATSRGSGWAEDV
jgi:ribosomal protein L11 methyltransferase